ncbi:MAG: hypothetical protein PHE26_07820 [Syntrophomonadaceae bacterium]|nr:hypothetical protein [Syntrophomonadaceae bacterium]
MQIAFSHEEEKMADRVNLYFKVDDMSFRDKIFHALLITQHDLEAQHFSNEEQHRKLLQFKNTLESLWKKLS